MLSKLSKAFISVINTSKAPKAIGPYSQAVVVNGLLYTSGCIAIDSTTNKVIKGSIKDQTHLCIKNAQQLLKAGNADLCDVFSTHVYLKDMEKFGEMNSVYEKYFTEPFPARVCIEASRLPKDVDIEIEVVAAIPK